MCKRLHLVRFALALILATAAGRASAATVQQITGFGNNPTGIGMYLYTPSNAVSHPPLLVGVHACHGKGTDVCTSGSPFAQQADKYGFLLVCPSAVSSDGCWDVHSNAVLTHDGGGDASGIISMVTYLVQNKNVDGTRVYVAGHSSGAMMTNVLVGSYPEVFKAGAAFAGVSFGCFAQGSVDSLGWNSSCANGNVTLTAIQWGNLVRNAYPDFSGTRPRIQLWHGTADMTLNFHNFGEEIKEWTNVLGVSATPTSTENNAIQSGWIRTRYTDCAGTVQVEAVQETGQPHNLVIDMADAVHFLGLDGSNPIASGGACGAGGRGGNGGAGGGTGGVGSGTGGTSTGGHGGEAGGAAGAPAAGGHAGAAGASGNRGGTSGGGAPGTGGAVTGTGTGGGTSAGTGGVSPSGGGGAPGAGGAVTGTGTGGSTSAGTGGSTSAGTGGGSATGGAGGLATGGSLGSGGTGGSDVGQSGGDTGCSCQAAGATESAGLGLMLVLAAAAGGRRRHRSQQRRAR